MKNVITNLIQLDARFSKFENKVLDLIVYHQPIANIDVANEVYKRSKKKPKCLSNGVTSAVRQINRKLKKNKSMYVIEGIAGGRGGKILFVGLR